MAVLSQNANILTAQTALDGLLNTVASNLASAKSTYDIAFANFTSVEAGVVITDTAAVATAQEAYDLA